MSCKSRRFHTPRSPDCVFVPLLLTKLDFSMFQATPHSLLPSRPVAAVRSLVALPTPELHTLGVLSMKLDRHHIGTNLAL